MRPYYHEDSHSSHSSDIEIGEEGQKNPRHKKRETHRCMHMWALILNFSSHIHPPPPTHSPPLSCQTAACQVMLTQWVDPPIQDNQTSWLMQEYYPPLPRSMTFIASHSCSPNPKMLPWNLSKTWFHSSPHLILIKERERDILLLDLASCPGRDPGKGREGDVKMELKYV